MYICSDLKSQSKGRRSRPILKSVDLCNLKFIESKIGSLKESTDRKNNFILSYEEITGLYNIKSKVNQNSIVNNYQNNETVVKNEYKDQSSNMHMDLNIDYTAENIKSTNNEYINFNELLNNANNQKNYPKDDIKGSEESCIKISYINDNIIFESPERNLHKMKLPRIKHERIKSTISQSQIFQRSPETNLTNLTRITKYSNLNDQSLSIVKLASNENKEVIRQYKKVFDKSLKPILNIKMNQKQTRSNILTSITREERNKFAGKSEINRQIVLVRDKLHFMKGVIDYCFPKIMIDKIKIIHDAENQYKSPRGDCETSKLHNFESSSRLIKNESRTNVKLIRNASNWSIFSKDKNIFETPILNNHYQTINKIKVMIPLNIRSLSNFE